MEVAAGSKTSWQLHAPIGLSVCRKRGDVSSRSGRTRQGRGECLVWLLLSDAELVGGSTCSEQLNLQNMQPWAQYALECKSVFRDDWT